MSFFVFSLHKRERGINLCFLVETLMESVLPVDLVDFVRDIPDRHTHTISLETDPDWKALERVRSNHFLIW